MAGGMGRMRRAAMAAALVGMALLAMPVGAAVTPELVGTTLLRADGTVWAWGDSWVGNGSSAIPPLPVRVESLRRVRAVDEGVFDRLVVLFDGQVWGWGSGPIFGYSLVLSPTLIPGLAEIVEAKSGLGFAVALRSDGTVWAWGEAFPGGFLGNGTTQPSVLPVRVLGLDSVTAISVGSWHSLALRSDGTVWAWGSNQSGTLGDGTETDRFAPVRVSGLTDVIAISAGAQHNLALGRNGTVWAWGKNPNGALGNGIPTAQSLVPVQAAGLDNVVAIRAGQGVSLAMKSDGSVWVWGDHCTGESDFADQGTADTPKPVPGIARAKAIGVSSDSTHCLAGLADGSVVGWGSGPVVPLSGGLELGSGVQFLPTRLPVLTLGTKHPLGNDLTLDFGTGNGIWQRRNNATWAPLHGTPAQHMVSADVDFNGRDDLVVDFGASYGIWVRMNDTDWVGLHGTSAREIARADLDGNGQDDIVIDFGAPHGIWARMNNASWVRIHGTSARHLTAADLDADGRDDLVVDFGPQYGIWVWMNHRNWVALHGNSAEIITAADMDGNGMADLVIDFGMDFGIWTRMNNAEWVGLHGLSTSRPVVTFSGPQSAVVGMSTPQIAAADMDGNGQDDVIIDFGPGHGIWVRMNNASWVPLHGTSAQHIAAADLDGNGKADVLVDFGTAGGGIWARMNNATWTQINAVGATSLASGQMDGN